jgi:Holliday junction DNA helicase RuvA
MVARANGVGPKLAERIVRELKDKVGLIATGPLAIGGAGSVGMAAPVGGGLAADAMAALASLGFKPGEASVVVNAALDELGDGATLDALVRLALRKAAK